MKVIEIISDTNIGGAGVLLINRLSHTDLSRYRTLVLLPKGSLLCPRLSEIGVEYKQVDCVGDTSFDIRAINEYKKIFKRERPHIVNCHASLSARIAAKLSGVPVKICTRHCAFPVRARDRIMGFFNNMLSDSFIAVADAAKDNLLEMGIKEKKITVIINGSKPLAKISADEKIVLRNKLNINENTKVLIFCARLEECKGHEWFFECVRILKQKQLDFVVLILGEGSQMNNLKQLSKKLLIEDKIKFLGFVEDISPYMNIANININCSVGTETSSLALSEGMSLGKPCVVSDYGGNPYMIRHGGNGFVCRCGDSEKMAEYINLLFGDEKLYKKMSDSAFERFKCELNAESMTQKTNKLYGELWAGHRA